MARLLDIITIPLPPSKIIHQSDHEPPLIYEMGSWQMKWNVIYQGLQDHKMNKDMVDRLIGMSMEHIDTSDWDEDELSALKSMEFTFKVLTSMVMDHYLGEEKMLLPDDIQDLLATFLGELKILSIHGIGARRMISDHLNGRWKQKKERIIPLLKNINEEDVRNRLLIFKPITTMEWNSISREGGEKEN